MNRQVLRILGGVLLLGWVAQGLAGELKVSEATVRATAPGQDSAAVSLRIVAGSDARLVAVSSPVAKRAELHVMQHENGMMKMRQVDSVALPAKQEVVLDGSAHIMLLGLKGQLKAGDSVQLQLTVEYAHKRREKVRVRAEVRSVHADHDAHGMEMDQKMQMHREPMAPHDHMESHQPMQHNH